MKKIITLYLALVLVLSLCACTEKQPSEIELTEANIYEYLSIATDVKSSTVDSEKESIMGIGITTHTGDATIDINVVNQSPNHFKNATITCEIYTFVNLYPAGYGWEFDYGNRQTGTSSNNDENYKAITISLPYDGNWNGTESLSLALYDDGSEFMFQAPAALKSCYLRIVDVKGTVELD